MSPTRDPGLQPERTNLSWSRTALRLILTANALLGWVSSYGRPVILVTGLLGFAGLWIYATQRTRYDRDVDGVANGGLRPEAGAVMGIAVCSVILGFVALGVIVAGLL